MARVEDYQYLSREREETGTHLTGRGWTATTGSNERGAEKGEWANKGTGVAHMPASVVWGEEEELEDQRSYEWLSIGRRSLLDFVLRSINFLNWRRNPTDRVERNPGDFVQETMLQYDRRKRMASTDKIMLLVYVSILIFGSFLTGYFFICLMSLDLLITDGCYQ